MKWVTRSHVHVDRVACPWLISRFVDNQAEFLFVPSSQVKKVAVIVMTGMQDDKLKEKATPGK